MGTINQIQGNQPIVDANGVPTQAFYFFLKQLQQQASATSNNANIAIGGTGAAGETGDMQFNESGSFAADSGNFYYDTTKQSLVVPVLTSTIATGSPPFVVNSSTPVDLLSIGGTAQYAKFAGNLSGGVLGSIPYQTAYGTTIMLPPLSDGSFLTLIGGVPAWQNNINGVGIAGGPVLPVSGVEGNLFFNTTDGLLYRWHDGAWTVSVPATTVTGQLTDSQLANIATAKLTGQITTVQITNNAITTPLLSAGAVYSNNIAANTIVGNNIAAATITGTNIVAGTITGNLIQANTIVSNNIQAGTITSYNVATFGLQANNIDTRNLTIRDASNNIIFGAGASINPSSYMQVQTGWLNNNITLAGSNGTISLNNAGGGSVTGVVMPGNPISAANISTYIQSAAIGTAYIANAAITNALIATAAIGTAQIQNAAIGSAQIGSLSVQTLNIANGAVTIPSFVVAGVGLTYGTANSPVSLLAGVGAACPSVTIDANAPGAPIQIIVGVPSFTIHQRYGSAPSATGYLYRNGALIKQVKYTFPLTMPNQASWDNGSSTDWTSHNSITFGFKDIPGPGTWNYDFKLSFAGTWAGATLVVDPGTWMQANAVKK